jgi:hypothetical protein
MPQRDTYRQSKPFCTPPPLILQTHKSMCVWWRSASFVSSGDDNMLVNHSHVIGSTLPQQPPAPIGPTASEILEELIPSSTNLETYNAEYLQRRGTSASVFLAAAQASQILGAPGDEVSNTVFNLFNPDINLSIEVGYHATLRESHAEPIPGFHGSSFLSKRDKIPSSR